MLRSASVVNPSGSLIWPPLVHDQERNDGRDDREQNDGADDQHNDDGTATGRVNGHAVGDAIHSPQHFKDEIIDFLPHRGRLQHHAYMPARRSKMEVRIERKHRRQLLRFLPKLR
jgi:hypothetical protein